MEKAQRGSTVTFMSSNSGYKPARNPKELILDNTKKFLRNELRGVKTPLHSQALTRDDQSRVIEAWRTLVPKKGLTGDECDKLLRIITAGIIRGASLDFLVSPTDKGKIIFACLDELREDKEDPEKASIRETITLKAFGLSQEDYEIHRRNG
jgi:hypothetical protein